MTAGLAPSLGAGVTGVTGIVAALPEEMAPLRSLATGVSRASAGGLLVERARLAGRDVALAVTGDGARNARAGVSAMMAMARPRALVVIGVAGALSRDLATASLVVASRVTGEDGRVAGVADQRQVAAAVRATGGREAVVVSAGRIADSADDKRRLAQAAGGAGSSVVDLESASFVSAAEGAGIPWLVLRAVSDTADEGLPELLNQSRDGGGSVRRGRVLLGLLREPGKLPFLLALRGRVGRCAEVLARGVTAALPTFAAPGGEA